MDVNPDVALAIAYGECGRNFGSYICKHNHNFGGIVSGSGFAKYENDADGTYEFVNLLHYKYYVTLDSGYNRLKSMSYGYSENPKFWINLVGSIYYELKNNGYDYSYKKHSYKGRDLIFYDKEEESFYRSRYNKENKKRTDK